MFTVARSLGVVASLVLFAAMPTAAAQAPSTSEPRTAGARSDCPVEPHPIAINPDVIACHARFAPLPVIPAVFDRADPAHVESLRAKGDVLLRQLDRPETCGKSAKLSPGQACAILIYAIDPEFRQAGLPWTYVVKIYRTSRPGEGRLRDTVLFTVLSNNSEGRLGPGSPDGEVWQLLAEQRATTRCKPGATKFVGMSVTASGLKPDRCRSVAEDARYHPVLLVGRGEAQLVLNRASIKRNFEAPIFFKECARVGLGGGRGADC